MEAIDPRESKAIRRRATTVRDELLMSRKPKAQHIAHARQLLAAGYLPSALPELLMDEFNLPPAQARAAAAAAMREREAEESE